MINVGANPSEDCLQLNVFAPSNAMPGDKLPVTVYIPGGAFSNGYSTFPYAHGARNVVSRENAIIVTINYRLGVFGFLPLEELKHSNDLNVGLQDVAAAFKWVRKHISEFGGDPHKVTASGLSAGAIAIGSLLCANEGDLDLFGSLY
jgi:carboxylesterase type B